MFYVFHFILGGYTIIRRGNLMKTNDLFWKVLALVGAGTSVASLILSIIFRIV